MITKEQFLNGTPFRVKGDGYKGSPTFYYTDGYLQQQIRSSIDERVMTEGYLCNVNKVGTKAFSGFVFIVTKKVNVKYKFEDLEVFEEPVIENTP